MKILKLFKEFSEVARLQKEMAAFFPSFSEQKEWLNKLNRVDKGVKSAHNASHILQFLLAILKLPKEVPGCIVEAGAYKGASTCKISLFADHVGRDAHVFDSFEGLPENNEAHEKSLEGHSIKNWFKGGEFLGTLEEVKTNITNYGVIERCHFHKGWFEDTMPSFHQPIALAYLDVDLASSTKTCLKYLYPLLSPGGSIYSQDGDFPLVVEVFKDEQFWKEEVGCDTMPEIIGLGKKITVIKKGD
jgi:O-methyltransferase